MTTSFTTHFRFGLPDFLSSPWQNDWYTLVQLIDSVLYEVALGTIIDVWANSTVYAVGNIRIDPNLGTIWTCLVAHTSAASPTTFATDRTNHPTFWGIFTAVDGDKGYIVVSGSNTVYTIKDGVVSNAKLADMGQATFKMRAAGAGTGVPIDGTVAQAKTALAYVASDITNLGVGVATWLATPSSANLLAAVTDETGTGALVFGTAPVLTSPTITTKISPTTDNVAPLGDTTHNFSSLFLGSGSVINWNNSDITLTHSANTLTLSGASVGYLFANDVFPTVDATVRLGSSGKGWRDLYLGANGSIKFADTNVVIIHSTNELDFTGASVGYTYDAVVRPSTNDAAPLGSTTVSWSDLFLATGGVINWNNGNVTITHSAGSLAIAVAAGGTVTFTGANYLFQTSLGAFGYGTGAGSGGTVTQGAGSGKATAVTLNKPTGEITTNNAALASATAVTFTLTNSVIQAADLMITNHVSGGTAGSYTITVSCAAGSAAITIRNVTAGSLSEAIVIRFAVVRGAVT
jgi:hypothetical protein